MAKKESLYTMVAGAVLEQDTEYNVRCNCGGDAPIVPKSVKGYGYGKKGGAMRVVDKMEAQCNKCGSAIVVLVIEGDPGYVLTQNGGVASLFRPQGSTSTAVPDLTVGEYTKILQEMQVAAAIAEKKRKKQEQEKAAKKKKKKK